MIFSCGWHITRDGKDVYPRGFALLVRVMTVVARALRFADVDDQVEAIADDALIRQAPAIVGRLTPSAVASGA